MNMKNKRFLALGLILLITLATLCGCGSLAKEAEKLNPSSYSIRIAGGPEGSEEAALAEALAEALSLAGYGTKVITTADGVENIEKITSYKVGLAIVSADLAEEAKNGTGAFEGNAKELQMLMALGMSSDGSRNVILCVADMEDAVAWSVLTAFANHLDVIQAACDGTEISMAEGNTVTPVTLQAGAETYFNKKPWN